MDFISLQLSEWPELYFYSLVNLSTGRHGGLCSCLKNFAGEKVMILMNLLFGHLAVLCQVIEFFSQDGYR
jgi:hypothetical protein